MATFNQHHQKVGRQINAETVYVTEEHRPLAETIDDLISQAGHAGGDTMVPVLTYLRQARAVSTHGDQRGAVALLRRAAEVAGPVTAIAAGIAAVVQGLQ